MSAADIMKDRYNKFRKIGAFRDFIVEGGQVADAEARREAAEGLLTATGRWAEVRPVPAMPARALRLHPWCTMRGCDPSTWSVSRQTMTASLLRGASHPDRIVSP